MVRLITLCALLASAQFALAQAPATPAAAKPKYIMPPVCTAACHEPDANQLGGYFESAAFKSQGLQVDVGAALPQILRFDPKTLKVIDDGKPKPVDHLREARKRHEVIVTYTEVGGVKTATEIHFKGPAKIDPDKLIDYAGVAKLLARGPNDAPYTLVDSRPLPRFQEGTIPGAIHVPFIGFSKFTDRLPKDKAQLVVFFCGGITCTLSPNSLKAAQKLGYTNVRVYREGLPEWQTKNYAALTPVFLKAAYVDKDIPHVLIDARGAGDATSGHIKGAVAVPAQQIKAMLKSLPETKLKAPIVVYDGRGGEEAAALAKAIVGAGQQNVLVLNGGMIGWQAAGYAIESGSPAATKVAYTPKPRAGSLPAPEFTTLARNTPADVMILDVRNPDEASAGMIKGAMLIPDEDLQAKLAEVPKDKRIVTHCATGIRAEMAYHKLKAAGYNAAFLNADIEIAKDGSFKLSPK